MRKCVSICIESSTQKSMTDYRNKQHHLTKGQKKHGVVSPYSSIYSQPSDANTKKQPQATVRDLLQQGLGEKGRKLA